MVIEPGSNVSVNTNAKARQNAPSTTSSAVQTANADTTTSASKSESVSLSDTGKTLAQLEAKIASSPEVDIVKVDAIKSAIANGTYNIDDTAIATKLLAQDAIL